MLKTKMPAIPSGRAWDACQIARKKCDSAVPICSRCTRLSIVCVGSGQRRFAFKGGPKCARNTHPEAEHHHAAHMPQPSPSSPAQLLAGSASALRPDISSVCCIPTARSLDTCRSALGHRKRLMLRRTPLCSRMGRCAPVGRCLFALWSPTIPPFRD